MILPKQTAEYGSFDHIVKQLENEKEPGMVSCNPAVRGGGLVIYKFRVNGP